mmetsp:Transcript_65252/g.101888  ORF Transcript_65252/g.101888 Transcript_65252/m.101888 type:complete len:84 (+) Transcript_65252:2678-2929(+)
MCGILKTASMSLIDLDDPELFGPRTTFTGLLVLLRNFITAEAAPIPLAFESAKEYLKENGFCKVAMAGQNVESRRLTWLTAIR